MGVLYLLLIAYFAVYVGVAHPLVNDQSPLLLPLPVDLDQWVDEERQIAYTKMLANIAPSGTVSGCVVAAQSKVDPPYWYYWIRDGAVVMDALLDEYASSTSSLNSQSLEKIVWDYVDLNLKIQSTRTKSVSDSDPMGLGEPKYNVDGSAFNEPWGRPQNDGPALRASVMARFVRLYMRKGGSINRIKEKIYRFELPSRTLAKRDLEMVASNWQKSSFDLWEEVKGQHFYTLMVQRRAMLDGVHLATLFNDTGAANWYQTQVNQIEPRINTHWNPTKKSYLLTTLNRVDGAAHKEENLDIAQIIALLHAKDLQNANPLFGIWDDRVLSTILALKKRFTETYLINQGSLATIAPGIGRYPEDEYMGGHPWFLCTLTLAQGYYQAYIDAVQTGKFEVTHRSLAFINSLPNVTVIPGVFLKGGNLFDDILRGLAWEADSFIVRVRTHAGSDGSLDEQFDRNTGFMRSAKDLTWSYASFLTAARTRDVARTLYPLN